MERMFRYFGLGSLRRALFLASSSGFTITEIKGSGARNLREEDGFYVRASVRVRLPRPIQECLMLRSRVLAAVVCAGVFGMPCMAQFYPNYNLVGSPQVPGLYYGDTYAVDLNNDGIPDLVVNEYATGDLQPYFAVFLAKGDGTFWGPAWYQYSAVPHGDTGPGPVPMAFGDFNGDGNIDIAMVTGDNAITVYLGKGDGTFVNPWHSWILGIPSDQYFGQGLIATADFNHDGKMDLAVVGYGPSSNVVYILPGEGNGLFSKDVPVLTVPGEGAAAYWGVQQLLVGDFDNDGNADLGVMASVGIGNGNSGSMTPHILYGNGNFGFQDTTPISSTSEVVYRVGDLNGDGKSDLYSMDVGGLNTYYGLSGRTFLHRTQASIWGGVFSEASMADFNDDGHNDLVAITRNYTSTFLVFYLATGTLGQFEYQVWNVPNAASVPVGASGTVALPVVGDFNHDGKPDWALLGHTTSGSTIAYTGVNETAGELWSNCDYPRAQRGINLCSPAVVSGPTVNFTATAHALEPLRNIQLWVDGKKLGEQSHTWEGNGWFGASIPFGPGTHYGTYFGTGISSTLVQENFTFTVPSGCSAPAQAGVHICWPTNGASINATSVVVDANATVTGTLARMEVWVDGVKKYTETSTTALSAAVMVSPGTHTYTVFAVNTSGQVWSAATRATAR
ncbi:VCBS repeat-containing protein [Acidobacteria bacterium AB60]|nr:VCBS repeat-containing protein [Acidobacteria bacterium AB60]